MLALRVASYNLNGNRRHPPDWCGRIVRSVAELAPDLVAFQEFPRRRGRELLRCLEGIGLLPGDGGADERVFYRPDAVAPAGHMQELVRARPEGKTPKLLNWSRWSLPGGVGLDLCNVHLTGSDVKAAAAAQIQAYPHAGRTVVASDFNLTPDEFVHTRLLDAGWQDAAHALSWDAGPTIHRYGRARNRRIDYILAPRSWAALGYRVLRLPRVEDEPSDHHPVLAEIAWDPDHELRRSAAGAAWGAHG